jgi:hypothetical protein
MRRRGVVAHRVGGRLHASFAELARDQPATWLSTARPGSARPPMPASPGRRARYPAAFPLGGARGGSGWVGSGRVGSGRGSARAREARTPPGLRAASTACPVGLRADTVRTPVGIRSEWAAAPACLAVRVATAAVLHHHRRVVPVEEVVHDVAVLVERAELDQVAAGVLDVLTRSPRGSRRRVARRWRGARRCRARRRRRPGLPRGRSRRCGPRCRIRRWRCA